MERSLAHLATVWGHICAAASEPLHACLQTVFFDLRKPVLEDMYQHHVESARMTPLLAQLDNALGDICAAANDSLHAYLARSLLQAITVALQRVLLDGGPYRSAAHYVGFNVSACSVRQCALSPQDV